VILERLLLENFKQFRERVELLPPEGAVGIVGPNGSGKTTIFESVLWAFFGSRGRDPRFSNDSVPWSGGTTAEGTTVGTETLTIGGRQVETVHLSVRTRLDGKTRGTGRRELWLRSDGLPVRWILTNESATPSPVGDVNYRERLELTLLSLEPRSGA